MSIDLSLLLPLGWSYDFSRQLTLEQLVTLKPARVIGVELGHYRVDGGSGEQIATLSGRYRHIHSDAFAQPTVGDWVLLMADAPVIVERLEPRSPVSRAPFLRRGD